MPSSTRELQEMWADEKGNITDAVAVKYLQDQGYTLTPDWRWIQPNRDMTDKEYKAALFLLQEFDYGVVA